MSEDTSTLFSLGEAVAFIGIILAVIQLASPKNRLIWRLSRRYRWSVLLLIGLGYLSPLVSILIPAITIGYIVITPASFQIAGFILISLGFVELYRMYTRGVKQLIKGKRTPRKIVESNIQSFYIGISRYIIAGRYEAVADILINNMEPLVELASNYDEPFASRKPKNKKVTEYAAEIIREAITDKAFMEYICKERYDFLNDFVVSEHMHHLPHDLAHTTYGEITGMLFAVPDSLLYRQMRSNSGSSRFVNVYRLLFENKDLLHRVRIIDSQLTWHMSKTDVPIGSYAEALKIVGEKMIDVYKKSPYPYDELFGNIDRLTREALELIEHIAYSQKRRKKANGDFENPEAKAVREINDLISHAIPRWTGPNPKAFLESEIELAATKDESYQNKTLVSLMAYATYKLMEYYTTLDYDVDDDDFTLYGHVLHLIHMTHDDSLIFKKYRQLTYEYCFEKCSENLDGFYPAIIKGLLSVLCAIQPSQVNSGVLKEDIDAWNKLQQIMKHELAAIIIAKKKMNNQEDDAKKALLPKNIRTVVRNRKITYYHVDRGHNSSKIKLHENV